MGRLETATSIRWAVWKAPLLGLRSTVELDRLASLFEENFTHFDKERRFTNRRLISVGGLESAPPWLTLESETRSPRSTFRGKLHALWRARRRHLRLAERKITP